MREIKFRGLRTDSKGWVYGCFAHIEGKEHYILVPSPLGLMWVEVIPDTVGQYTGLKDKNGVEIYEGDIVNNGKFIYQVEYSVQNSHFRITPVDRIEGEFDSLIDTIEWGQIGNGYYSRKDLTITGNIHDNN